MAIEYIQGDLFEALRTASDIGPLFIPHIVNDKGAWGSGFVVPLGRFYPTSKENYLKWWEGEFIEPPFKLGQTQFVLVEKLVCVCNMLAQTLGGVRPLYYNHLARCMDAVAIKAKKTQGKIWAPMFGSGLAGGDWQFIEQLIQDSWDRLDIPVTVYHLEPLE